MQRNSNIWYGWRLRVWRAVTELGYRTFGDYARSRPEASYAELSEGLGGGIAAIHMRLLEAEAAESSEDPIEYMKVSLVRILRGEFPDGWAEGEAARYRMSNAFSRWTGLMDEETDELARVAWATLEHTAPAGWYPTHAADPVIAKAFAVVDGGVTPRI